MNQLKVRLFTNQGEYVTSGQVSLPTDEIPDVIHWDDRFFTVNWQPEVWEADYKEVFGLGLTVTHQQTDTPRCHGMESPGMPFMPPMPPMLAVVSDPPTPDES